MLISKRTKTPILCSKRPKTGVPKANSAQKPRFCARNARKRGFRKAKAHKNLDFVLETPENEGPEGQKRTKTPILCSKRPKTGGRRQKAHKNADFVLGKMGERHRKRRNWHREAQPWPSCKSPRTLPKCKYLITRRLTFVDVLDELKSRPPRTPLKYKYLITRQLTFASVLGDLLELHPRPGGSLITHRIPAPWPGSSLIRRRYGGGVGNRCRWAERFAMSEQRHKAALTGMGTYI